MKAKNLTLLSLTILALCGCKGQKNISACNETVETHTDSLDMGTFDDDAPKGLNDIRFGDWEDKDWRDNDYLRAIREACDIVYNEECGNELILDGCRPLRSVAERKQDNWVYVHNGYRCQ